MPIPDRSGCDRLPLLRKPALFESQARTRRTLLSALVLLVLVAPAAAQIPGEWIVEEGRVRLVRSDGRGEHTIELLADDQIRVVLPIGVTAYYRRKP